MRAPCHALFAAVLLAPLCSPADALSAPKGAAVAPFAGEVIDGKLSKAAAQAVFARGPQPFIASLRVKAAFDAAGRFAGFQIVQIHSDSPLAGSESVRPGDVVTRVNGLPIERPEQFMTAWEKARSADRLEIDLRRGDSWHRYRWAFVP